VFRIGVLLAISASLPLPTSSVASGAAVAVCFAPEEDCAAFAVRAIDNVEREISVGASDLTTGSGIVEALVSAKGRGVVPEQSHTVAAGHTGNIARARSLAEVALRAYVADWREVFDEQGGDG
jgi:hypothetical protein